MIGSIYKVFYRKNIKVRAWSWMGQGRSWVGHTWARMGHGLVTLGHGFDDPKNPGSLVGSLKHGS